MKKFAAVMTVMACAVWSGFAADRDATSMIGYLPSGSNFAAVIEVRDILASPLYAKVLKGFPELAVATANFEAKYQIPLRSCRRILLFDTPEKKTRGAFIEFDGFSEADFAAGLAKLGASCVKTKAGERTLYTISVKDSVSSQVAASAAFVAADTMLITEDPAVTAAVLTRAAATAETRERLCPEAMLGKPAFLTFIPGTAAKSAKDKSGGISRMGKQAEEITAELTFSGEKRDGILLVSDVRYRDKESVGKMMMSINGLMFLGAGMLFADNPELGQQLMQKIRLTPSEHSLNGQVDLDGELVGKLVDHASNQVRKMTLPPEESEVGVDKSASLGVRTR